MGMGAELDVCSVPTKSHCSRLGTVPRNPGGPWVRGPPKVICIFSVCILLGRGTIPSTSFSKRPRATTHYGAENSLYSLKPLVLT